MTPIKKKILRKSSPFLFLFLAYPGIDEVIQAVKSKEVDGMLLDRFTASYYQSRGKLKSLIIVKKLELQREVGVLFSQDREKLAECLNVHLSSILKSVQTFTDTYKVTLIKYKKGLQVNTLLPYYLPAYIGAGHLLTFYGLCVMEAKGEKTSNFK